jgi:uncharacterized protein (DUF1499 family)
MSSLITTNPAATCLTPGHLRPCPPSPNCVCSEADDAHHIEALILRVDPAVVWQILSKMIAALPRTRIVTLTGDYLHAECRSALFRFVDDLELELRAQDNRIAVRSASRLGYWDLGVNRKRVERLRHLLATQGLVESGACG